MSGVPIPTQITPFLDPSRFSRHVSLNDAVGQVYQDVDRTDINDLRSAL